MSDVYESIRSMSFPVLCSALGLSLERFRTRKAGSEHYGPCPLCKPKKNVTAFSYDVTGRFHCFSCQAKGRGAIDLVKLIKGVGFQEAVALLSTRAPTEAHPAQSPTPTVVEEMSLKPYTGSYEKFKVECEWLNKRVPDARIRELYGVYMYNNPARKSAYSGRVMLPVRDIEGTLYGYLGRNIEHATADNPKYMVPRDFPKSRFLFGAYELRQHLSGLGTGRGVYHQVYLVESPFCVMHFASLNLPAVAAYGWSLSPEQVDILATLAKGIVYLPDRNKSADCAGVVHCLAKRLWTIAPTLPEGVSDPEEMSLETIRQLL